MRAGLRTRTTRAVAGLVLVAGMLGVAAGPAGAGDDQSSGSNGPRELVAEVMVGGSTVGNVSSPWADCTFRQVTAQDIVLELLAGFVDFSQLSGTIEVLLALIEGNEQVGDFDELEGNIVFWYDVVCPNGLLEPGGRAIWPVTDAIPQRVVDAVTRQAYDNQQLPLFYANAAPAGTAADPLVTGVETHLWLDDGLYGPVEAQATIPGLMQVTVTATPRDPVWRAGDGTAAFTCNGAGEAWNDGDRVAECGHVYRNSTSISPSGVFTLAVTTTWDVVSVCVNLATGASCGASIMPPRIITSTRPVTVAEIQAVVTDD